MGRIVRRRYPAARLPEDLREGIDPEARVTVTIVDEEHPRAAMSLEDIFAAREPPFLSRAEIDEWIFASAERVECPALIRTAATTVPA